MFIAAPTKHVALLLERDVLFNLIAIYMLLLRSNAKADVTAVLGD